MSYGIGYHWVVYKEKNIVAEWTGDNWIIPGMKEYFTDANFLSIDANVLTKEQYDLMNAWYSMMDAFDKASIAYKNFMNINKQKK